MRARKIKSGRTLTGATLLLITLFGGTAHADTLTLMWDPSGGSVSGYAVYAGTSPQSLSQRIDVGGTTSFTMPNAVPGQQYCFAVAAYDNAVGEGPKSSSICGTSNQFPSLASPGTQSATVGQPTSLQLNGSDPDGQPLTYSASGLPPGLSLMSSTGFVSGTPTTSGTYPVTASVSDGTLSATASFTWSVAPGALDTTPPQVSILSPTVAPDYSTATATLTVSGTTADNVSVSSVTWQNDRGGSGTAIGVASWSVPGLTLQPGSNHVAVTAHDGAGNASTKVLNVTYDVPTDTSAPVVTITSPTSGMTYTNLFSMVTLAGAATDDTGVTAVTWSNNRGGSGTASGTSSWSVPSVSLLEGDNVITVFARDAAGNVSTDALTVTYVLPAPEPPAPTPDPVVLDGTVSQKGWRATAILGWSPIAGSEVDVLRDGAVVARTSNNGKYWEDLPGPGTWTFQVCATDGSVCSNTLSLTATDGDVDHPGRGRK